MKRIIKFVAKNLGRLESCWPWDGCRYVTGYGKCGRNQYAHREIWRWLYGDIPVGLMVCHTCDAPDCCNPVHMFLGNQKENMADMVSKTRQSRGSNRPSAKLTEENVVEIRRLRGLLSQNALAAKYGVNQSQISRAQSGERWRHCTA